MSPEVEIKNKTLFNPNPEPAIFVYKYPAGFFYI
jgi:hypothetical protein